MLVSVVFVVYYTLYSVIYEKPRANAQYESLTRTNFIREGLPKGGHSSTHTRNVP